MANQLLTRECYVMSENNKTLEAKEHSLRTKSFYIFTIKRFKCSKDTLLMSLCPLIDFPFLNCPHNSINSGRWRQKDADKHIV